MPAFLAGLAALLILVFGARLLATANPQKLAVGMRMAGGILLLLVAAFLIARGALPLAIPLAFFGLALLGVPMFLFQEGREPRAERAFKEIARLTRGAYCHFDAGSARQLRELLTAVAVYATGGRKALQDHGTATKSGAAMRLLEQLG